MGEGGGAASVLVRSELTTAVLRFVAGLAMETMWVAGGLSARHGSVTRVVLPAALAYSVLALVVVARLHRRSVGPPPGVSRLLTVLDNAIILGVAGLTGAVESPVVAILVLVVTTNAARLGVRVALGAAVADSVGLAVLALALPHPDGSLAARLRLLGWWSWLLIGGATIAGVVARAALEAERAGQEARRQAEVERSAFEDEHRARADLEARDADRRDFLRVVTHELRTPITSLGALSRAVANDDGPPGVDGRLGVEGRREALELIRSHAGHLERLLAGVGNLATGGLDRQPGRVVLTEIPLEPLVRTAADAAALDPARLHLVPGVASVVSDREKLQRILTNLIENAGRHSEGRVTVSVDPVPVGCFTLRVADRGPGLDPDVAERAFDKGFSFGPHRGSSGLGLWIVRELAGVLGGRVWAGADPGGGLVVSVELPLHPGS